MMLRRRGWNKQEEADAGCTEDGDPLPKEFISEEEFMNWREWGKEIVRDEADRQWRLGEWIVEGETMKEMAELGGVDQRFKNPVYKAAADITGYSVQTIKALANVVHRVPKEVKEEFKVSFAHLKLVASLDVEHQRKLLTEMERSNLTVKQGRDKVAFFKGARTKRKSKGDRQAARIAWHCKHLTKALESIKLSSASPKAYEKLLDKMTATWHEVGGFLADSTDLDRLSKRQS